MKGHQFRFHVWDPWLLVFQMVAIQFCFYSLFGIVSYLLAMAVDADISLDLMFSVKAFDAWQIIPASIVNALIVSIPLWLIVGRAKQCLDFAATLHFFHLIACSYYGGFPTRASWWITQIVCCALMSIVAEYLCIHGEMVSNIDISRVRGTVVRPPRALSP